MMSHHSHRRRRTNIDPVRRVILASSNHVMGGYKDDPSRGPSSIHPHSDPKAGTVPLDPDLVASSGDGVAYAAAKLAAERLAMALGDIHGSTTTFVVQSSCASGGASRGRILRRLSRRRDPPRNTSWTEAAVVLCRRRRHRHRGCQRNNPRTRRRTRRGTSACVYRIGISSPTFPLRWIWKFRRRSQRPAGRGKRSGKGKEGGARTGTSGGDSSWSTPCRAIAMPSGISTTPRGGWGSLVRTIPWRDIPRARTIYRSIGSDGPRRRVRPQAPLREMKVSVLIGIKHGMDGE